MKKILMATALAALVVMSTACEPSATITAKPDDATPVCASADWIRGKVTPASATPKVALQRTVGGKWVDWKWYATESSSTGQQTLWAKVDGSGAYALSYRIPGSTTPIHLRVRSSGGGVVSPGFYVKPTSDDPEIPCPGGLS